jgi:hypothetical protein
MGGASSIQHDARHSDKDKEKDKDNYCEEIIVRECNQDDSDLTSECSDNEDEDEDEDEDEEIHIDVLFPALLKFSFIFDVDYSIATRLIAVIVSSDHTCYEDQSSAVKRWAQKYADLESKLTSSEIYHLIKYVELYNNDNEASGVDVKGSIEERCRLMCPFRCEVAAWTAEIRGLQMHKSVRKIMQNDDISMPRTVCMSSSTSSEWFNDSDDNVNVCDTLNRSDRDHYAIDA